MLKKITNFLLTFLELQLFVTLFSWPILIAWGLPLSWATPLGNLIFGPILTLFVFLGSLCIVTELIFIPNGLLITALEYLTQFWLWALSWGTNSFFIYFPKPTLIWLLTSPACAIAVIVVTKNKFVRIALFCLFLGVLGTLFHLNPENKKLIHQLPCGSKKLYLITFKKKSLLIIPENMKAKRSFDQWVQYTLLPALIKITGNPSIDCVIVFNAHDATQEWIKMLQEQVECKKISYTQIDSPKCAALQFYTAPLLVGQTDSPQVMRPNR